MSAATIAMKRQPLVDETEAATAGTVTTSTVKHDVTAKITVHEDEEEMENRNCDESVQDPGVNQKLEVIFAEATTDTETAPAVDPVVDSHVTEGAPTAAASAERKAKLAEQEVKITQGLATFVEVGTALSFINVNRLYLPEYKTWEQYVDVRWGFTKQRAHQYMDAADGHQKLSALIVGNRKLPTSERGMRELLKVPQGKVVDILDKLGDEGELTAERIIKVREQMLPKKTSSKVKKKPVIKIDAALKSVGVWTAFLAACDLGSMTEQQRKDLQKANKNAAEKFSKLSITA